jgi:hypothetical protein
VSYHFAGDLPEGAVWGLVGWLSLMIFNSFRRWQKDRVQNAVWKTSLMTKAEHDVICNGNREAIKDALKEGQKKVVEMLEEQNTNSSDFRRSMGAKVDKVDGKVDTVIVDVGKLKTDVAVLQATQPNTTVNVRGS